MSVATTDEINEFWLNEIGPEGWYRIDEATRRAVKDRFLETFEAAKAGQLDAWATRADGALALLILLDQFPRNLFRGAQSAFATDRKALCIAKKAICEGHDMRIAEPELQFFYLPLMHSESLMDQERCVRLFLTKMPRTGAQNLPFAREHRETIRRFGRFPYRNDALGRASTVAEQAYLEERAEAA